MSFSPATLSQHFMNSHHNYLLSLTPHIPQLSPHLMSLTPCLIISFSPHIVWFSPHVHLMSLPIPRHHSHHTSCITIFTSWCVIMDIIRLFNSILSVSCIHTCAHIHTTPTCACTLDHVYFVTLFIQCQ